MEQFDIVPKEITKIDVITKLCIDDVSVQLFKGCSLRVICKDASDSIVKIEFITLTKEEYDLWNDDDTYIINLVANKLGVTPISVVL